MKRDDKGNPTGNIRPISKNEGKPVWQGFCDIILTETDKDRLRGVEFEADDILGALTALVEQGYKVSLTDDVEHGMSIASATGQGQDCANRGYTLSARSGSLPKAVMVLWYKHHEVAHDGVWSNVQTARSGDELG